MRTGADVDENLHLDLELLDACRDEGSDLGEILPDGLLTQTLRHQLFNKGIGVFAFEISEVAIPRDLHEHPPTPCQTAPERLCSLA